MTDACKGISEDLVAYVDGELTSDAHEVVSAHVGSCLSCRREVESIKKLGRLVDGLSLIEPSAELAAGLDRRLAAETVPVPTSRGRVRMAAWPFAAAAAVALALGSILGRGALPVPSVATLERVELLDTAARVSAPAAAVVPVPKLAARSAAGSVLTDHVAAVAATNDADEMMQLMPEDLPPDLLERPELYLRLPVVKRLEKLEHFEAVRPQADRDRVGQVPLPQKAERTWG